MIEKADVYKKKNKLIIIMGNMDIKPIGAKIVKENATKDEVKKEKIKHKKDIEKKRRKANKHIERSEERQRVGKKPT